MTALNIPLADWSNGVIMIGVFTLVVVIIVVVILSLMNQDKKNE
jgi:hypothetical protein